MKPASVTAGGPDFRKHQLVSLWDLMRPFALSTFLLHPAFAAVVATEGHYLDQAVSDEERRVLLEALSAIEEDLVRLDLPVTLASLMEIQAEASDKAIARKTMAALAEEFNKRLRAELHGRLFMELSVSEASHHDAPLKGWEYAADRFPSSGTDIEEANKCFALARYTACVFHLMRVLEPVLKEISAALGIVKHSPTWNTYLAAMPAAIQTKYPEKNAADGEKREYYSGLEAQLRAIKTAWRNPTMHDVAKVYTQEMASELLVLVRGFMRETAERHRELPEDAEP